MGTFILAEKFVEFILILLCFMCFSIGLKTLIKREVKIGGSRVWRGWSTLVLGIPLILVGVVVALALLMTWMR